MPKAPTEQSDEKSKELITACDAWIRKSIMEKLWKNKTNKCSYNESFQINHSTVNINIKTHLITIYRLQIRVIFSLVLNLNLYND